MFGQHLVCKTCIECAEYGKVPKAYLHIDILFIVRVPHNVQNWLIRQLLLVPLLLPLLCCVPIRWRCCCFVIRVCCSVVIAILVMVVVVWYTFGANAG